MAARARRSAEATASVPELANLTCSTDGTSRAISAPATWSRLCGSPSHRPLRQLPGERGGQFGVRIAEQVGTVTHVEVDQLPAFDVPDPIPFGPLYDEWLGDRSSAHAAAHPAGDDLPDGGELPGVRRLNGCCRLLHGDSVLRCDTDCWQFFVMFGRPLTWLIVTRLITDCNAGNRSRDRIHSNGWPRHSVATASARRKGDNAIFCERDFKVNDKQILDIVHQTAAQMMVAQGGEVAEYGPVTTTERADSLIDRYGFSSIDTLKYLLTLEEKFGVTLADEDFNEELLSSATALAERIAGLCRAHANNAGQRSTLVLGPDENHAAYLRDAPATTG